MGLFESIADRRIREARANGLFDNLPGAGKPIPDLGTERPAGWWAARVVKTEQDKFKFEELSEELKRAMAPLWRLSSRQAVMDRVGELNQRIEDYNSKTSFQPIPPLDPDVVVNRWRDISRMRP